MERARGRHGGALIGRAEIDTSRPFRSVKEAVMLFGEKVLAEEIANKLNEIRATTNKNKQSSSSLNSLETELEQIKKDLRKAQEERKEMENYLHFLRHELEKTKIELKQLKSREREKPTIIDSEVEDIKFVENSIKVEIERPVIHEVAAFERNNYVKFTNPSPPGRLLITEHQFLDKQVSMDRELPRMRNRRRKKSLLPMIASIFSKKKSYQDEASITCTPSFRSSTEL